MHLKYEHILGTIVSERRVWRPFLQWASVLGKKAKKNLCILTARKLINNKEREQVTKSQT